MKKLINWLKWLDNNLIHLAILAFIVLVSLVPKYPIQFVEYTYIRIRIDDILPAALATIFLIQWVRRKIQLNTKFLIPFVLFWIAVFISFAIGAYVQNTVPVNSIGLLHSLRRVQYMIVFFVASSAIVSEKHFMQYMKWYLGTLLVVALYGLGQRFLGLPSIQSMNPAYVDGRLLVLNPEDRINSTFGGHFDLAAYLSFSIPILLGFYLAFKQIRYFVTFVLGLIVLLFTAARSSFAAYFLSTHAFLLLSRKYKLFIVVFLITVIATLTTGEMIKRLQSTLQFKVVYINEQTGVEQIDQKITTKNLPAGGYKVGKGGKEIKVSDEELRLAAVREAIEEAKKQGKVTNTEMIDKRAAEIAKFIRPERTLLCDISCATRLQIEWPRAISAFMFNPVFGSGPSSITEATDNDLLRWLGELGLIGTGLFIFILFSICRLVIATSRKFEDNQKFIYKAYVFGVLALLINGLYIDVFEASKVAYNFWLVSGFYVGVGTILLKPKPKLAKKPKKVK